ncbi:hypothetical protein AVEN_169052-1 [Araneus ventricosus]|uniref:Transposable element Tc3 transposase n=1 Tax=Araneus ventricosus TaxID=182803 RepID=A0A4Y2TCJ1_ARAVE|nr:hypothetical protein AVEN_169052-1 [Araneus ventricosus]
MIWTDEACVSRNGLFNRQNVHTWSLENMRHAVEVRHQLRWSINVLCGIFNNRLIGPVFYEGTLTGQRYLKLLQDVITDFVENLPLHQLRNVWFQHDGAHPHKISNVKLYLMETFQNQVIGYGGFVEWPPRSPDLTPLDFFLWGDIKVQVCATPPPTLQDLRRCITDSCASVTPAMLHNVQREIQSRLQLCIVSNEEHFEKYKGLCSPLAFDTLERRPNHSEGLISTPRGCKSSLEKLKQHFRPELRARDVVDDKLFSCRIPEGETIGLYAARHPVSEPAQICRELSLRNGTQSLLLSPNGVSSMESIEDIGVAAVRDKYLQESYQQ